MLAKIFKKRAENPDYIHIEGYPWQRHDWVDRLNTPANRASLVLAFTTAATQLPNGIMESASYFVVTMACGAVINIECTRNLPVRIHPSLTHHAIDRTGKAMPPANNPRLLVRTRQLLKSALFSSVSRTALNGIWYGVFNVAMANVAPHLLVTSLLMSAPMIAWPAMHFGSMALRCHKLLTRRFVFAANPTLSRVMPKDEALFSEPARPALAQQITPR